MQSTTSAGSPARRRGAAAASKSATIASICADGATRSICSRSATTLGVPTSARTAVAFRLSDESVTWSKSIRRSRLTPPRRSRFAVWLPTPPRPMMMTSGPMALPPPEGLVALATESRVAARLRLSSVQTAKTA